MQRSQGSMTLFVPKGAGVCDNNRDKHFSRFPGTSGRVCVGASVIKLGLVIGASPSRLARWPGSKGTGAWKLAIFPCLWSSIGFVGFVGFVGFIWSYERSYRSIGRSYPRSKSFNKCCVKAHSSSMRRTASSQVMAMCCSCHGTEASVASVASWRLVLVLPVPVVPRPRQGTCGPRLPLPSLPRLTPASRLFLQCPLSPIDFIFNLDTKENKFLSSLRLSLLISL